MTDHLMTLSFYFTAHENGMTVTRYGWGMNVNVEK